MKTNKEMEKIVKKMKTLQDYVKGISGISSYIIITSKDGSNLTVAENLVGKEEDIFNAFVHEYEESKKTGFISNVLDNFFKHSLTKMVGSKQTTDKPIIKLKK